MQSTRRSFLSGAATLSAMTAFGFRPARAQTGFTADRPMKLGFITPLSGPIAAEGEAMKRGLELGIASINAAGGVGGKPIEIVMQDNQSLASMAATIAKKFIEQEQVDLIIGTVSYDESTVVERLAARAGVPFITLENGFYTDPNAPSATCAGNTTMVSLGENVFQMVDPLVEYFTRNGAKRWAFVGSDYQFPRNYLGYARAKLEALGATVEIEEYAPIGTGDWSTTVSKLNAAKPDVILSAVVGGDAIAMIKTAEGLGLLKTAKITGPSLMPELYPALGSAVDGQMTATHHSSEIRNPRNDAFKKAYIGAYGEGPIPTITSTTYDAVSFIKAAAEKANALNGAKLYAAFDGLQAMTTYSDQPITLQPGVRAIDYPMRICRIEPGGKWAVIEEAGVIPNALKPC